MLIDYLLQTADLLFKFLRLLGQFMILFAKKLQFLLSFAFTLLKAKRSLPLTFHLHLTFLFFVVKKNGPKNISLRHRVKKREDKRGGK